jgi:hypothetical protein
MPSLRSVGTREKRNAWSARDAKPQRQDETCVTTRTVVFVIASAQRWRGPGLRVSR